MSKYINYALNNDDRSDLHQAANPEVIVCIQGANSSIPVSVNSPHLKSLTIERKAGDTANNFKLEVLDTVANDLEYNLLASGSGNITIKYRTSMNDYAFAGNGRANAEGFIEQNNSYIEFSGMITKLASSWINNRNMLTLEGIVGLSIQDMYQKFSFNWNKVPKFDWDKVFSDYVQSGYQADMNADDSGWENFWNNVKETTTATFSDWSYMWNIAGVYFSGKSLSSKKNSVANIKKSGIAYNNSDNAKAKLQVLMDHLKIDAAGNYYIRRDQYSNTYLDRDKDDDKNDDGELNSWVKQSGEHIVPMRPSNLCAFICEGGDFVDLLYNEEDFEQYKGTSFYNGDARVSILDWWWIELWYKKMGHFDGIGLTKGDFDSSDLVENDLTQSAQSFTDYFEKVLIPVSKETIEKTEKKKDKSKDGKYAVTTKITTQYVYTNYMFTVDDAGVASYKRFNANDKFKEDPVATYYYYSSDNNSSQSHGVDVQHNPDGFGILQSFSAKLDILTAMITNGNDSGGDISNINLVYGGKLEDSSVEVDPEEEGALSDYSDWGKLTIYSQATAGTETEYSVALADVGAKATTLAYEADATIVGSCGLKPLDIISINVVRGISRSEGNSYRHHTSGTYLVQTIEESIVSGKIISRLHLVKNANRVGTTAATGLVESTTQIKSWVKKNVRLTASQYATLEGNMDANTPHLDDDFYDENNWNNGVPSDKYIEEITINSLGM